MGERFTEDINTQNKNEIKELLESINKLTADENDMSFNEYKTLHESTNERIGKLKISLKNSDVPEILAEKYKSLVDSLVNSILNKFKVIDEAEKLVSKSKIVDLNGLSINSNYDDEELTIDKIINIKPELYIAKNGKTDYYVIDISGKKYILRINSNSSDTLAVLSYTGKIKDEKKLIDLVRAGEISNKFSDIEIDGSKSLTNIGSGLTGAIPLGVTGALAGAGAGTLTLTPFGVLAGGIGGGVGGAVSGFSAGVLTDFDLTTERAEAIGLKKKLDNLKSWYPDVENNKQD